jgi:HD-like signal output (HDOD) protein
MTTDFQKQGQIYRHPALEGLGEEQLIALYNSTSVKKINAGEILVKEGDTDTPVFLILEGSATVVRNSKGRGAQITLLRQGDCLPESLFFESGRRTVSVIASESLSVRVLDEGSFSGLPPQIQLAMHKNMNKLSAHHINDIVTEKIELFDRNRGLTSQMSNLLQDKSNKYANSEMIQGILKKIPRLPMFTDKLTMLLLDKNVSTRKVAETAKQDPSLVGAVLKSVNSAYYGFQHPIADFQHALLLLGFNQVYQLVVDIGIRSIMPKTADFRELQIHSIIAGFISFEIAKLCKLEKALVNNTIGLLHDIGKSIILLIKKQRPKMEFLIDMLDHTKIGSLLLKEWNIPDEICRGLEYQSYAEYLPPEEIPTKYRKDVAVLHIAHLCYYYLQGRSEYEPTSPFLSEYMDILGVREGTVSGIVNKGILPLFKKNLGTFPQDVRSFLMKSVDHIRDDLLLDSNTG